MRKVKIGYYDSIPKIDKIGKYRALYEYEKEALNNCGKKTCPLCKISKTTEEFNHNLTIFGRAAVEIIKEIKYDYEAYDTMHSVDGIVGKSTVSSRL